MKFLFINIFSLLFIATSHAQQTAGPEVRTKSGVVRGGTEEDVSYFKGIPYAAPPIGANRWRPPQPVSPWKEVRDATKDCADCPQRAWPGSTSVRSENCLFLNVWAPTAIDKKSNCL